MKLVPLGDQAVLAYLPDEAGGGARSRRPCAPRTRRGCSTWCRRTPASASSSTRTRSARRRSWRGSALRRASAAATADRRPTPAAREHAHHPRLLRDATRPARVCEHTGLSADDVIRLHTATEYTVYAIGFVPGFPYLGYLPPELCGVRAAADARGCGSEPGSVGLTGPADGHLPAAAAGRVEPDRPHAAGRSWTWPTGSSRCASATRCGSSGSTRGEYRRAGRRAVAWRTAGVSRLVGRRCRRPRQTAHAGRRLIIPRAEPPAAEPEHHRDERQRHAQHFRPRRPRRLVVPRRIRWFGVSVPSAISRPISSSSW